MYIAPLTILVRVLAALVFGAALGIERERRERAAGLRTHTLVSMGGCLMMITSSFGFADVLQLDHVSLDPSRVAAQIVSGIGFLGAGLIVLRKQSISGLTTAAGVWVSAGIGMACGGGLYWLAGMTAALVLAVQTVFRSVELRYFAHHHSTMLKVVASHDNGSVHQARSLIVASGLPVRSLSLRRGKSGGNDRLDLVLGNASDQVRLALTEKLSALEGVILVKFHGS